VSLLDFRPREGRDFAALVGVEPSVQLVEVVLRYGDRFR
jgi:hypothetical protein